MDGTPRLRSAFPATPQADRHFRKSASPLKKRISDQPLPQIPELRGSGAARSNPLISEDVFDAPSQRLYAVSIWALLWGWKIWDFMNLQDAEEQSLWLFMKWVLIDGIYLFFLPSFRIPWLEWSPSTMTLLFTAHALADGMLMFQISIPLGAGVAALSRSFWGAYEMAVSERTVNPETVRFNESLILGRQVIHILPEGSAILNPEREAFCLDNTRTDARLPIWINATNPISIELQRIDLHTDAHETINISKSQIKTMHKEAFRLKSYSDKPNEPKTIFYTVKKPGLYLLQKVVDESDLEVVRKQLAHTAVVPCPKAILVPTSSDKCKGELSNLGIKVTGTPPLKLKYRKVINQAQSEAVLESIQPEDFTSPLLKSGQNALVPNRLDTSWAKPREIQVPLSESLHEGGKWVYAIEEVTDGLSNTVKFTEHEHAIQERQKMPTSPLHQVIKVHERPTVTLRDCDEKKPLKIAKGSATPLPLVFGSSGKGVISDTSFHLDYVFSAPNTRGPNGEHSQNAEPKKASLKNAQGQLLVQEPGLYTLTGISSDFCRGDILEPAACVLQNPPEPELNVQAEAIVDKCVGKPIGLRVDMDLIGTPPFKIKYRMHRTGDRHRASDRVETIKGLRGQIELTPDQAGDYVYEFTEISDAVYGTRPLSGQTLDQSVKPAASARFVKAQPNPSSCIDDAVSYEVALQGDQPFNIEYEIVHGNKRTKRNIADIKADTVKITTDALRDGGDYTIALVSVTDREGCKEFLKDEAKISVRNQKPKVGFGLVDDGTRTLETLQGKTTYLPLRFNGEGPWSIKYRDPRGNVQSGKFHKNNDVLEVHEAGNYELIDVQDVSCPGVVDDSAKVFSVSWIPRPEFRIAPGNSVESKGNTIVKAEVCQGDDDATEVLFKGVPPYHIDYVEQAKLDQGSFAPKQKELRTGPVDSVGTLRMNTQYPGLYEYKLNALKDDNYKLDHKDITPITIQQRVNPRPQVAFAKPGSTYPYCSVESNGEEVIPITLKHGLPPFDVELEIKHHGTVKPETVSLHGISSFNYDLRIPHSRIQVGKSAVQLRRVSDSRGCSRLLDSSEPRVQISVHDAPTVVPLDNRQDFCVGERLNFALSGAAPFTIVYRFEGKEIKAVVSSTTFTRLAEKPGIFTIISLTDSASKCTSAVNITKTIHGMPWARISKGRDSYVDIHEGGQADIQFDFGGTPPFEFTYTRSSNTERGGRKGVVLDMRSESSPDHTMHITANEEGTYEVVAIKDRYCSYTKPGVKIESKKKQRLLQN